MVLLNRGGRSDRFAVGTLEGELMRQINIDLEIELQKQIGLTASVPVTVDVSEPGIARLAIDFVAVDSMSCSFVELRLTVPALVNAAADELKKWGDALCQRVTYLLENIGSLECDEDAGELLIRSTAPQQIQNGAKYYEIILQTNANGSFTLRRYEFEKGTPGRTAVNIQLTHEVLLKLVEDLMDTIP
jgi:hypothetical protein